jgi:hypothetical protein
MPESQRSKVLKALGQVLIYGLINNMLESDDEEGDEEFEELLDFTLIKAVIEEQRTPRS